MKQALFLCHSTTYPSNTRMATCLRAPDFSTVIKSQHALKFLSITANVGAYFIVMDLKTMTAEKKNGLSNFRLFPNSRLGFWQVENMHDCHISVPTSATKPERSTFFFCLTLSCTNHHNPYPDNMINCPLSLKEFILNR